MTPRIPSTLLPLLLGALLLAGCRGMISEDPPIHPNLNMDFQEKFQAQEQNLFFADGRAMRTPVPGTVARGFLREDTRFYLGRTATGEYVDRLPVAVTPVLLERGAERYDIFCAVCHGQAGFGQGIIMEGNYGYTPAPSFHVERIREVSDGYLYDVIANGVRNMPGYAQQIPVADRWAIAAHLRVLQRSQAAEVDDLPASVRAQIEVTGNANIGGGRRGADATATPAPDTTGAE